MLKSMEFRGKTTDDAVAKALAELGLVRDEVSVEIIERGKSGFLGIGAVDAVVRVTYDSPEEESAEVKEETAPAAEAPVQSGLLFSIWGCNGFDGGVEAGIAGGCACHPKNGQL